ncbi:serine/threonine protein phosphatase I [Yoonia vestfoldensis SKA53]|uniref:Serine/threonine protein phosphatase I n=2 Tax=Yoonia vestfoldensis TaxID=245188 RepID=A3V6B5_9RHOB|nr:serine/threonine protein phosphatase I [Yoonia vestfoldensis SKA53]
MRDMMSFFKRRPAPIAPSFWQDLQPPEAIYAIGDVHGRRDLLAALEAVLAQDWTQRRYRDVVLLYLGDLIDRGPHSAHVLDHLTAPAPKGVRRLTLLGNHEEMFLAFVDRPEANIAWLDHGGGATLNSYGIYLTKSDILQMPRKKVLQYLSASIPSTHLDTLRRAPRAVRSGDWRFTHAGLDPAKTDEAQTAADLTWGVAGDVTALSQGAGRLVFGHFAADQLRTIGQTSCIDTGAYATDRLTALRVTPGTSDASTEFFEVYNPDRTTRQ